MRLHLPVGFRTETLPAGLSFSTPYGTYSSQFTALSDGTVQYVRRLELRRAQLPAAAYHAVLDAAGAAAAVAPAAMALGDSSGTTTVNGNGASQMYGNIRTGGYNSPSFALIQGSFNKPCIALPAKVNAGSLIGAVPISIQDLNVLTSPQNQQCTENSTQSQGDGPLSHILDNIPVLSGNLSAGS